MLRKFFFDKYNACVVAIHGKNCSSTSHVFIPYPDPDRFDNLDLELLFFPVVRITCFIIASRNPSTFAPSIFSTQFPSFITKNVGKDCICIMLATVFTSSVLTQQKYAR